VSSDRIFISYSRKDCVEFAAAPFAMSSASLSSPSSSFQNVLPYQISQGRSYAALMRSSFWGWHVTSADFQIPSRAAILIIRQ
jgi:hypothetical protein